MMLLHHFYVLLVHLRRHAFHTFAAASTTAFLAHVHAAAAGTTTLGLAVFGRHAHAALIGSHFVMHHAHAGLLHL